MAEALQYPFFQNALGGVLLGAVACGLIGSLVVVNRLSSLTGSVAHASFGGLGLSYLLGFNPLAGATLFSLGAALGTGALSLRQRERSDTAIAVFWAVGMALGLVFISLSGGYAVDLMSYLFGSILTVAGTDLLLMAILDVVVVAFVAGLYKELLAISFDREFSIIRGVRADTIYMLFLCLVALTVVMLMRIAGLILVIALLTIPAAVARLYVRGLGRMMAAASVLSALFGVTGLFVSWFLNIPSGASIIVVAGAVYGLAHILRRG
jgi:zinc transport system permease protein